MNKIVTIALCGMLAACGTLQPVVPDTARLPAGALGGGLDPDVTAINLAAYAFADSSRTYGKPLEAARASAALEYAAGAIYTSPRWANIGPLTKEQLLQGRQELHAALGVMPGATSQQVVDALVGAATALAAEDTAGATRALGVPTFSGDGAAVLARLSALPYMRMANVGTSKASNQLFDGGLDERL